MMRIDDTVGYEEKLYRILGAISATDIPIVFKGALITKLILSEYGFAALNRSTRDIDANWIGTPPSMNDLVSAVNQSLSAFSGEFYAEAMREYGDRKSAGLIIVEAATGGRIISMDVDIKPAYGSRIYYYGEIGIRGVLPNDILADKIIVLSGSHIFRRAKDLVDVYALAHCVHVQTSEIYDAVKRKSRKLGAFDEFYTQRQDVEHAYNRLSGIDGKPSFEDIYSYLCTFVEPFAQKNSAQRVWNFDSVIWEDIISHASG